MFLETSFTFQKNHLVSGNTIGKSVFQIVFGETQLEKVFSKLSFQKNNWELAKVNCVLRKTIGKGQK